MSASNGTRPRFKAKAPFVPVPRAALDDERLDANELLVLVALEYYGAFSGTAWPKQPELAARARIGVRALRYALENLVAFGYVRTRRTPRGLRYELIGAADLGDRHHMPVGIGTTCRSIEVEKTAREWGDSPHTPLVEPDGSTRLDKLDRTPSPHTSNSNNGDVRAKQSDRHVVPITDAAESRPATRVELDELDAQWQRAKAERDRSVAETGGT